MVTARPDWRPGKGLFFEPVVEKGIVPGKRKPVSRVSVSLGEQHFSPKQLAASWGLSPDFIRDEFKDEDVLIIDGPETLHKRG
jgi:hypothetical protein